MLSTLVRQYKEAFLYGVAPYVNKACFRAIRTFNRAKDDLLADELTKLARRYRSLTSVPPC